MDEIQKILEKDEKVIWKGQPVILPYIFGPAVGGYIFGIFWWGFLIFSLILVSKQPGPFPYLFLLMEFPFLLVGLYIVFQPIYFYLKYKNTCYAITNKRFITQTGVIGRDYQSLELTKTANVEVRIGVIDKIFGKSSGSLIFTIAGLGRPLIFAHIKDPYSIFNLAKSIIPSSGEIKPLIENL